MKRFAVLLITAASLVLAFAAAPSAGNRDTGDISGRAYDVANGRSLTNVWVAVSDTHQGTWTDSDGHFLIESLPAGSHTLIAFSADYELADGRQNLDVRVVGGRETTVNIPMTRVKNEEAERKGDDGHGQSSLSAPAAGASNLMETQSTAKDKKMSCVSSASEAGADFTRRERPSDHSSAPSEQPMCLSPQPGGVLYYSETPCPPRDMFFRDYGTNGFVETRRDRFSTFAVDVDDASYTLVRRYLQEGHMPPDDAVRAEEFINHFDYGYNNPESGRFRVFSELTDSPFDRHVNILKIGIKGREAAACRRKPLNLTLVIDVSGSMGYDNRMDLVKRSLRMLVEGLEGNDQVGIAAYNTSAWTVLDPVMADDRRTIFEAIERLYPGGSTNAEAGLTLGYQIADRQFVYGHNNMVILCSDGVANVGETGPEGIIGRVRKLVDQGITLQTFGFGMGNYNDVLLEQLAQKGNGRYAYVNDLDEAGRVFVSNLVANTQILARDVKIQVEFNPDNVRSYRLVGYENRAVADNRFRDDRQDGGEVGAGHEVTALYELVLTSKRTGDRLATVSVRAKDADQTDVAEHSYDVLVSRDYKPLERSRPEIRLAMVACRFADLLKGTEDGGPQQYGQLLRLAQQVSVELPGEQTRELAELVRLAADLSAPHARWDEDDDGYANNYKR